MNIIFRIIMLPGKLLIFFFLMKWIALRINTYFVNS